MTIVVLIILATVSINAVMGENGLIKQAEKAGQYQANAEASDSEALESFDQDIANAMAGIEGNGGDDTTGNIDPETGWDLDKVNKVTSEDNVVVPVPKGYTASTVTGEKSVATGFVIKEGTDGSATSGINEFVWVPVPEISDLYDEANNAGQLWDFSGTTSTKRTYPTTLNSSYREPDVVTGASSGSDSTTGSSYDAVSTNLQQAGLSSTATASDFKTQLQNEFNEMVESVEKYGGFYIGRYETGNLSQTEAVVQKGNTDIGNQTWYTQYKLSKTIGANENVVSSMIWGSQWDATLRWMQTSIDASVVNFVTDSTGKGHYCYDSNWNQITDEVAPIATGSVPAYAVNNIYDMAGNVYDWSLEAYDTYDRTVRGSCYDGSGSVSPASIRGNSFPTVGIDSHGSRSCLYVAL